MTQKQNSERTDLPADLAPFFQAPPEFADDFGPYRSPLLFDDGRVVQTAADWATRRQEILQTWHAFLGPWPPLIPRPRIEYGERVHLESFTRHQARVEMAADGRMFESYLFVPDGEGPFPAVLVVYYEAETGAGLKGELRDFAYQLAKRGFVTLSTGTDYTLNYPSAERPTLQPLSALAYAASNGYNALASRPEVDARRIGVTGHSYGGKWAMFASCLDERFACAAWSDGGIVFDESRSNVNYWEPWYLGYDAAVTRERGVITPERPRTGAYRRLVEQGRDLHELHALMAPRPFLVSGGSEDPPARWQALNHTVAVNTLLGYRDRVGMTNRATHAPTAESNEQLYRFFAHFLG